jgi:hypothetical protein
LGRIFGRIGCARPFFVQSGAALAAIAARKYLTIDGRTVEVDPAGRVRKETRQ